MKALIKTSYSFIGLLLFATLLIQAACTKDDGIIVDDPPVVTGPQQYGTPFDMVPATSDINLYEVNPKVFSASGDLDGITARLDSLEALGINVVWLMPIYQTGSVNSVGSPYAIRDYKAVHSDYGTLVDLRELVDRAHSLGMAVILDWVANHTSWDNSWINNPSWYTQDANGNIIHPPGTNWQDVADLNFDNTAMREAMIGAMKYWTLEANVDGFRCDYADGVPLDFWEAAIDTLRSIPDRDLIMFAEGGNKLLFDSGFDMIFGWPFYSKLKEVFNGSSATGIYAVHLSEYHFLEAEGEHIVRWVTNHDEHAWEDTPQATFGSQEAVMAAFVLTSHLGGVPLVYNGLEVAVPYQLPFFEGTSATIPWGSNPAITAEYSRILNFRLENEALRRGSVEDFSTEDIVIFKRVSGTEEVLVLVNVRNTGFDNLSLPAEIANTDWFDAYTDSAVSLGATTQLLPYQYRVLYK